MNAGKKGEIMGEKRMKLYRRGTDGSDGLVYGGDERDDQEVSSGCGFSIKGSMTGQLETPEMKNCLIV